MKNAYNSKESIIFYWESQKTLTAKELRLIKDRLGAEI